MRGRTKCERCTVLVGPEDFEPVAVRLLQVVAEHLLDLGRPVSRNLLEPGGVPLVQLCAELLRHGVVCRLADQHVAEAKAVDAGERRPPRTDQLLPDECIEACSDPATLGVVAESLDGARVEDGALDRRPFDGLPLVGAQLVEP